MNVINSITRGLSDGSASGPGVCVISNPGADHIQPRPLRLITRHRGLFEERGSESVQQGRLLDVCDMSHLTFGRASGWHLTARPARPWHFMYHAELLGGKGERGKFTYRDRRMNIAYWSAHETGCSDPDVSGTEEVVNERHVYSESKCCYLQFIFIFDLSLCHRPNL